MRAPLAILGLVIGLFALVLQFAISIPASMEAGRSFVMSVVFYFSYFTILTNIVLVLVYASELFGRAAWLAVFRQPIWRATAAAAITLVGTFYHIVLAPLWRPEGLFLVCDVLLHYVTPTLYVIWFAAFNRTATLSFARIPLMLVVPFLYLVYVMIRGAIIGEYPYAVFDAADLGYGQVAINAIGLVVILSILNAVAIAIDRFRPSLTRSTETG